MVALYDVEHCVNVLDVSLPKLGVCVAAVVSWIADEYVAAFEGYEERFSESKERGGSYRRLGRDACSCEKRNGVAKCKGCDSKSRERREAHLCKRQSNAVSQVTVS